MTICNISNYCLETEKRGGKIPAAPYVLLFFVVRFFGYLEELQNLYQLLGYELILKEEQFDVVPYSGNKEKVVDLYGLEQWLLNKYPEILDS